MNMNNSSGEPNVQSNNSNNDNNIIVIGKNANTMFFNVKHLTSCIIV